MDLNHLIKGEGNPQASQRATRNPPNGDTAIFLSSAPTASGDDMRWLELTSWSFILKHKIRSKRIDVGRRSTRGSQGVLFVWLP